MDDLFLKIIGGEIPSVKIYEDEYTFAFLDIKPVHSGHTLVVPKKQYRNLLETPNEELAYLFSTVKKVAKAVKEGMEADGLNVTMNIEPAGGQVVFHTHVHIIPRFEGDGLRLWAQGAYREGEAEQTAEKIRAKLNF